MGKFNFSESEFENVKEEAEKLYGAIGSVHCPYFKGKVIFNVRGLKHLKFKSDQQARPRKDQYPRLKLLHCAPFVLQKSSTVQGIKKERRFEIQKTNSRWERVMKEVAYYEFIAVLDSVRVKVIVKEVYGSEMYFWSVIPFWGIDKANSKRILHSGDPEHD